MFHHLACFIGRYLVLGYALEEFASLAELHDEDVVVLVIVDFVEFGDVRMVEGLENTHLVKEAFVFLSVHISLLDLFSCTNDSRVPSAHFIDAAESTSAELTTYFILVQKAALLHLEEALPLHSDLLYHCLLFRSNGFSFGLG